MSHSSAMQINLDRLWTRQQPKMLAVSRPQAHSTDLQSSSRCGEGLTICLQKCNSGHSIVFVTGATKPFTRSEIGQTVAMQELHSLSHLPHPEIYPIFKSLDILFTAVWARVWVCMPGCLELMAILVTQCQSDTITGMDPPSQQT